MLDHWRFAWQILSGRPISLNPALQAYVTLLLKVTRPLTYWVSRQRDILLIVFIICYYYQTNKKSIYIF